MTNLFGRDFNFIRTLGKVAPNRPRDLESKNENSALPNYSWVEIVPTVILLVGAIGFLALFPSCSDNGNCIEHVVNQNVDLDKVVTVLNNSTMLNP